ncbi:hypothetical protein ACPCHQ_21895 [Ralstonia thomasii]|uniref:hypothetical protein n=1 Tax=Ralstonia thomasii TaxID=3058596 RepID=UPI003C2B447B
MSEPKTHPTSYRISPELKARVAALAMARGSSASAVVTAALESYLETERLLEDLHAVEDRLAATLATVHREAARASDDVQLVIALLDLLIKFQTAVTPEVVDRRAAGIVGERRYRDLMDELKKSITTRGRATIADRLAEDREGHGDGVTGNRHG